MSAHNQPSAQSLSFPGNAFIPRFPVMLLVLFVAFCANAQKPLGIDVSSYQGASVNWASVKASGRTFAWAKATEGASTIDADFTINEANAKTAGVFIGAYHYAHPELHLGTAGADVEAAHFWTVASNYVKGSGVYLMPMLDMEQAPGSSYTKTTLSQWVNRWCQDIVDYAAAKGVTVKPVVYTGVSYSSTWLDSTVTVWPSWIANYNTQDPQTGGPSGTGPWATWNIWQNSSTTTVPGVTSGFCDTDVFNGTAAGFTTMFVIGGANVPYITSQPSSRYGDRGGSLSMRVSAGGAATLKYQWRLNAANIAAATTSALTLTNIQTSNAGNYTVVITNTYGSITSSIATLTVNGLFTPVFSDNFDTNSSTSWTLNRSSTDTRAIFAYDYSTIAVPAAPNSSGTTKGLRMEANLALTNVAALNVSPTGKSFGGNYRLHFDMWINANGPFPGGGNGSTEAVTAGLGTAGNHVEWNNTGAAADGVWFEVVGEGGASDSSTTQGDFVAYIGTNQQAIASGVYLAGTDSTARSDGDSYYQNVFPGGQTPPSAQVSAYAQQTGSLDPGTVGFVWRDVVVNKTGSTVEWFIDGLKIATVSGSSITSSNIFVGYWDPYPSVSDNTNLSFGLIDNLRVEVPVVAPVITGSPQNLTVNQGSNATFTVTATGTPSPTYQWRFNGTNIVNASATSYTATNVQPADAGTYSVIVTNIGGSVTSSATLTINSLPTITAQPADLIVNAGAHASFSVAAGGTPPLTYQWRFNNANIASVTSAGYSFTNAQSIQGGYYSVIVSNVAGFVISSNALLTVTQVQFDGTAITVNNGLLQFNATGAPGAGYILEASTNLVDWDFVTTLTNSNGIIQFSDALGTNTSDRFYRVGTPR